MEEARRFLRYVIPGLTFFIELSLYLLISADEKFITILKEFGKGIGFPVSLFLASAGVGFLMGVFYHALHWTCGFRRLVVNHVPLIRDCVNRGWIRVQHRENGSDIDVTYLSQSGAWRIVTAYWHERKESSMRIKAANPRIDSLTDIMHGLGAIFVGSVVAAISWTITHYELAGDWPSWFFYILPLSICYVHLLNYTRVIAAFQSVADIIVTNELKENYNKRRNRTIVSISCIDLNRKGRKIYFCENA